MEEDYGKKKAKELMKNNVKLKKLKFLSEEEQDLQPTSLLLVKLASIMSEKALDVKYNGDISDLGNEVGYCLGHIIKDMTEEQIRDFISGLKHGISLTNGTH
jgi:predicted hydrocarbon binding protein